ncbi:MAG: DUF4870 domain-containing protein [Parcubacteria group bacterium]|nr:DUF4870 domain-containing protein [Parcubacteria group bacterium]
MSEQQSIQNPDIANNRIHAALAYVWILCVIPLVFRRDSEYAQFHGKQGFMLLLIELFSSLLGLIPNIGFVFFVIGWVYAVTLSGLGVIRAAQGEKWQMPIWGEYAKRLIIGS